MFEVGTAAQVWVGQATVTPAMLVQALAGRGPDDAALTASALRGRAAGATPADVRTMQAALRADFAAADAHWAHWRAQ
jgi:hypothetical protein